MTATDLVLTVTEILRQHKVVGKFVEFFGEGTRTLALPDRATIGNMAPEYGATMGFFPVDERPSTTSRAPAAPRARSKHFEAYFKAQGLFGVPAAGEIDYSQVVQLNLGTVTPSLAGLKRPQDRIELGKVCSEFSSLFSKPIADNGFNRPLRCCTPPPRARQGSSPLAAPPQPAQAPRAGGRDGARTGTLAAAHVEGASAAGGDAGDITVGNGDVLIAAITSCTNTSNLSVMLAAGLLFRRRYAYLKVQAHIKTSLAPGSRASPNTSRKTGLLPYLEKLGFALAGYAAPPALATRATSTPGSTTFITTVTTWCAPPCCRATATSRRASTPT